MQATRFKPTRLASAAVCGLLVLGAPSEGRSSDASAPAPARSRPPEPRFRGGAAQLLENPTIDTSIDLRSIPISCPTETPRLPGFNMKCVECHVPQSPGKELPLPEELAKRKAETCAGNLKYIGLAARTWSSNHNGYFPGTFASMAKELKTPKIAACPERFWGASDQKYKVQSQPTTTSEMDGQRLEFPTWSNLDRNRATYQIVSPTALRRLPAATYVRCKIHGTVLRADGSVVSPSPEAIRMLQAKRKTVIPRIACIAGIKIGASTQEDLAKRWGEGLSVTGGHPNSGRVWRVHDTPWVVRTDGFEYSERGLVVDSFGLSEEASPLRDAPWAKLDQAQFSWLGQITPGLTRSQLLEILGRERLPAWPTVRGYEVYADGFHRLEGLDLKFWTAAFEFDQDKLRRLTINAAQHR